MTSLKGDLRSIMGTPFGGVGHAVLIFSRVTRAAFNSDSVVLQLHDRIEMPEEANGKFQVDGLDPGPIRIELEGGTVHNHGWNIDLPDEGVWSLTDLVDAQVDWSPAVIGRAEAAAREARDHADRAEAGADRVGTAEQGGVWASEASASASDASSARYGALTARNAAQSASEEAEGYASSAATSESNAATSETNAKQSETNAGDYAAVATTAATEAVDAMERATDLAGGDFATHEYVDGELESLDPRLLNSAPVDDLSFAVVDKDNRRTWLEVAPDGGPTDYALSKIRSTGGSANVPDFPTADWAHWGDSNTDDRANKQSNWTNVLAGLTGANHYNGGYWGQGAENIAARQGGAPSLITLAGNQTNASGATDIVEATNLVVADNIDYYTVSGTLAGVPGTITPNATTKVHTFTPTTPGVYDIPPRSVFTPDTDHLRDRHVTIWMGRNDRWEPRAAQSITWAARHMVDHLTPRVKRVLVLQLVPGVEGLEHPQIKSINDMLQQEFPSQFVPIAEWMMTDEAATLAGITYTEQDLTDIAEGRIPSSFRRDNSHFNEVGCVPIAHFLYREIQERGWI